MYVLYYTVEVHTVGVLQVNTVPSHWTHSLTHSSTSTHQLTEHKHSPFTPPASQQNKTKQHHSIAGFSLRPGSGLVSSDTVPTCLLAYLPVPTYHTVSKTNTKTRRCDPLLCSVVWRGGYADTTIV